MRSPRLRSLIIATSLILATLPCLPVFIRAMGKAQNNKAAQPQVRSDMLVSTDWLAKHVNDPNVFV
ncbi:MAG: hypothetical protein ACREAM_16245, partial [Blastocatellia bacterium]